MMLGKVVATDSSHEYIGASQYVLSKVIDKFKNKEIINNVVGKVYSIEDISDLSRSRLTAIRKEYPSKVASGVTSDKDAEAEYIRLVITNVNSAVMDDRGNLTVFTSNHVFYFEDIKNIQQSMKKEECKCNCNNSITKDKLIKVLVDFYKLSPTVDTMKYMFEVMKENDVCVEDFDRYKASTKC